MYSEAARSEVRVSHANSNKGLKTYEMTHFVHAESDFSIQHYLHCNLKHL